MNRQEKKERQAQAEAAFKSFTKDIQSIGRSENVKHIQDVISEHFSKSQDLYPLVRKKLAGSTADAKHLKFLLHLCSEAAKRINTRHRSFDLRKVIENLKREHKDNFVGFIHDNHADCLASAPTFEYFYGAIKNDAFELRQPKKRAKVLVEDIKPISAAERNISNVCEDSTPKEVERVYKRIKNLSATGGKVKFLNAVIVPDSFTQTVENIFHTSFLVKEGSIGIKDSNNEPVITCEDAQARDKQRKQYVLSFSMKDFNQWKHILSRQ